MLNAEAGFGNAKAIGDDRTDTCVGQVPITAAMPMQNFKPLLGVLGKAALRSEKVDLRSTH